MKTANKTTDFQMCPEINTREEDGEKSKGGSHCLLLLLLLSRFSRVRLCATP